MTPGFDSNASSPTSDNSYVEIRGSDNLYTADVITDSGVNRLAITGTISENAIAKATFVVNATSTAIGNNKSMLSLVNAGGSTVVVKVRELYLINTQTSAVTGVVSDFGLYRITGHSAGTSITPLPYDTLDVINGSITARTGSTVTGEAASPLKRVSYSSDEWGVGATDVESYDHTIQVSIPLITDRLDYRKPITMRAGEGISVKHTVNSTAGTFDVVMIFTQE